MLKSGILLLLSFSIISVNSQLGLQLLGNNGGRGNFRNVDKSSNSGLLGLGLTSLLTNNNNNVNNKNHENNDKIKDEDKPCEQSETIFDGERACKNAIIFQEKFQDNLQESKWIIEQYIPTYSGEGGQNYEFVSYRNSPSNVYILNKVLHIKPITISDTSELRGTLDLTNGCTSKIIHSCTYSATAGFILPPISSGKIRSRKTFKYGRIDIEAKLPRGDWVYPIISLGSTINPNISIVIAYTRGNDYFTNSDDKDDIGSRTLFGGAFVHPLEPERSQEWKSYRSHRPFNLERRVFSTIWQPGKIISYVDGIEYATTYTNNYQDLNSYELYLTIGVGVGGINDFPDGYKSSGEPKPWMNKSRRNLRDFVESMNKWISTWSNENQILKVSSVKITAL